jgi:hypothetical protein
MSTSNELGSDDATTQSDDDTDIVREDTSASDLPVKPWNPKDIRITTKTFTVREIYTQLSERDLDLAPDFQRAFVWSNKQQVRLVESILLGIPLPAFYFNQDETGAHQVVDGVQRLTTIRHFMSDNLPLTEHLEYLSVLDGSKFSTLDPIAKRRFNGTQIVAHVIEPQTPDDVKYTIFSRVNTGGSPLTAQEIRHCMSRSLSRGFLKSLVELPSFDRVMGETFWSKDIAGERIRDNRRMFDRELALRFCAFLTVPISEYSRAASLDTFLLEFTRRMDKQPSPDLDLTKLTAAFDQAMTNCFAIMGQSAFRYWPPQAARRGRLNRAIFESQAIALAEYPLATLLRHKDDIYNALRSLFNDPDYEGAVRAGTGDFRKVSLRISLPRDAIARILS